MQKFLLKYKKREFQGLKECVSFFENLNSSVREEKLGNLFIEDPIYCEWVKLNIIHLQDINKWDHKSLEIFFQVFEPQLSILVQVFCSEHEEKTLLHIAPPNLRSQIHDLCEKFHSSTTPVNNHLDFYFKKIRQLQEQNKDFIAIPWRLPDISVVKVMANNKTGRYTANHYNDKLALRGFLQDGKKEGIWEYFSPQGHLLIKGTYAQDIKKGPWIFFFPDGKTKAMGRYENNIPWGEWKYWNETGKEHKEFIQQITEDHIPDK
jgi:hypothetical protein